MGVFLFLFQTSFVNFNTGKKMEQRGIPTANLQLRGLVEQPQDRNFQRNR